MTIESRIEKLASNVGVIALFVSLNPFLMWIIWPGYINIPVFIAVLGVTVILMIMKSLELTGLKLVFSFFAFFLLLQLGTPLFSGRGYELGKIITFLSLICILSFNANILLNIFLKFRKLIIFFCWISLAVFFLTLIGVNLPYHKIPGFTIVMTNSHDGSFYKLYGLVVSSTNTVYEMGGLTIARICGPFLEPGHFSIYIGILLIFEKIVLNKVSKVLIITGALTFSPTFLIFLVFAWLYEMLYLKKYTYIFKYFLFLLIPVSIMFFLLDDIKDEIVYLFIGRNFEASGLSLFEVLDDRAGKTALHFYNNFKETPSVWYGKGLEYMANLGVLSDWRGMVFKYGIIGFGFSLLMTICIPFFSDKKLERLIISLIILIIYLHRSWMFENSFLYLFLIIGLISKNIYLKRQTNV
ncbi:hypothetical protein [Aequorivita viscosa]|uniref:O-antigen ligase like membrane protein n=1 Tax=Aequorivita viscosa TaxID=797419 RepID=A0A1M6FN91_9FLAO|nr:hypothetical protein [Aequorivita viscosa]SDW75023.1 hypothetical protein SAMN05216556_109107 [Aequorivita viscosa]SHI99228.1 hypothetical protein SAMN04487908_1089 [Aequorivita viscosa]